MTLTKSQKITIENVTKTQCTTYGMIEDLVFTLSSWDYEEEANKVIQRFAPCISAIPRINLDDVFVALDKVQRGHEEEN